MLSKLSASKPWFKVNPNYLEINVANDLRSDQSIYYYYQSLIKLRHDDTILKNGTYKLLLLNHKSLYVYQRVENHRTWLIVVNMSETRQKISEIKAFVKDKYQFILKNDQSRQNMISDLAPYEAFIVAQ